jgi:ABC-type dipeptide/oligopeptide/nickel transport system permease component
VGRHAYIGRRLAFAAVTVWVAITMNFVLFRAVPGDAVDALGRRTCSAAAPAALRHDLGLDQSLLAQYGKYLSGLAHADLGRSLRTQQPVLSELAEPIKTTLPMVGLGTLFAILLGTLTGVVAAWRHDTAVDRGSLWTSLAFFSMPAQWLGLMLIFFVAEPLGLPTSGKKSNELGLFGDASTWQLLTDRLQHMLLPALTLGLVLFGNYALITRSAMLETLGEDYVLTARAKGLRPWAIVRRHAFPNAVLPVITLVGLSLGFVVGGTFTIEYVFSYPGVGFTAVEAIRQHDYPVLQGIFLLLTLSVVFFNLLADLLYGVLDPRVRT